MRSETMVGLLAALVLGSVSSQLQGSLLYLDLEATSPAYELALRALRLSDLSVSTVLQLGPSESFFDQAAVCDGNGTYYVTVQHPGPPVDPFVPDDSCHPACATKTGGGICCRDPRAPPAVEGTCYGVADCADMNSGHSELAETIAITLPTASAPAASVASRMNTSTCIKLFATPAPGTVLCLAPPSSATVGATLQRFDLLARSAEVIGTFPAGLGSMNEAAAYDAKAGVVWAYLGAMAGGGQQQRSGGGSRKSTGVGVTGGGPGRYRGASSYDGGGGGGGGNSASFAAHSMNVHTGELGPITAFPPNSIVSDFVCDNAGGGAVLAAYSELVSSNPVTWTKTLARLQPPQSAGAAWSASALGGNDTFGVQVGKACEPGTWAGAAKACYGQLNNAFIGNGVFFLTAFAHGPPETLLGVSTKTGEALLEFPAQRSNLIDMAWTAWEMAP